MGLHPQMNREMSSWGREYASWTAACSGACQRESECPASQALPLSPEAESSWQVWKGSPVTVQSIPSFHISISGAPSTWKKEMFISRPYGPSFKRSPDREDCKPGGHGQWKFRISIAGHAPQVYLPTRVSSRGALVE